MALSVNLKNEGSNLSSSREDSQMSESSTDADVSVTFGAIHPNNSYNEDIQQDVGGSISSPSSFSSYFRNHFISNPSLPLSHEKDGVDLSLVKQEEPDTFTVQNDSHSSVAQEGSSSGIQSQLSTPNVTFSGDQAVNNFLLHKNESVASPLTSVDLKMTNSGKDLLTSQNSFDTSLVKIEPSEDIKCGEDEAFQDALNKKHQETLKQYVASEIDGEKVFQCQLCDFSNAGASVIKTHMYVHLEQKKPFKCTQCDSTFKKMAQLKRHKLSHHEPKPLQCPKSYTDSLALKNHIVEENTGDRPLSCNFCSATYVRKTDLKKHMEITHREDRPFQCTFCNYRSKDQKTLNWHLTSHSDARPYQCSLCPKAFKRLSILKVHIEKIHKSRPAIHKCPEEGCSFATSKLRELRRHALIHTDKILFPCPECQQNFTSQTLLQQHLRRHSGDKVHKCTLCDYGCLKLFSLKRHVRSHLVDGGNQCPVCQEGDFLNESDLIQHILNHSQDLPYRCSFCPASFLTPTGLRDHKVVHKEERPYICSLCGVSFKTEPHLKRHILGHTQERPFKCDVCGKGFMQKNHLNIHKVVHSDEKPFSCSLCSYTCKRAADLRVHMLCHSQARTISCNLCSYTCKTMRDLNRHMNSHSTDRPYECPVCGVRLRRAYNLRQHMLRHGEQERGEVSCALCLESIPNTTGLRAHMAEAHPEISMGFGDDSDGYGEFQTGSGSSQNEEVSQEAGMKQMKQEVEEMDEEKQAEAFERNGNKIEDIVNKIMMRKLNNDD